MDTILFLTYLFGGIMIVAGIIHFLIPKIYFPFIPHFLEKKLVNYLVGIGEIMVGIAVFIPALRYWATLSILVMMSIFLIVHIQDIFKERPAIGSRKLAYIRLPLQVVLIYWAWIIYINSIIRITD